MTEYSHQQTPIRWAKSISLRCLTGALCLLCSGLLVPVNARAQQLSRSPKIGVALQGGGAKGLAHVGVLQWFEDHHIPVDLLAGTSMGGLVGGLYAVGYQPSEIRDMVTKQINWDTV